MTISALPHEIAAQISKAGDVTLSGVPGGRGRPEDARNRAAETFGFIEESMIKLGKGDEETDANHSEASSPGH